MTVIRKEISLGRNIFMVEGEKYDYGFEFLICVKEKGIYKTSYHIGLLAEIINMKFPFLDVEFIEKELLKMREMVSKKFGVCYDEDTMYFVGGCDISNVFDFFFSYVRELLNLFENKNNKHRKYVLKRIKERYVRKYKNFVK
jgi:NAD+--asparagine ADP-ribosyltransferase